MDYVVGSVAALISGNVTPNRPKITKKASTPIKHPPSPNVTPKSQIVNDRSMFLSPTLQKKQAIVKKSPKRIFQNNDLESTENTAVFSPKADKVKKHLDNDLAIDNVEINVPKKIKLKTLEKDNISSQSDSVITPIKKKKKHLVLNEQQHSNSSNIVSKENAWDEVKEIHIKAKKKKKLNKVPELLEKNNHAQKIFEASHECKDEFGNKKMLKKRNNKLVNNKLEHNIENEDNILEKVKSRKDRKKKIKAVKDNTIVDKDSEFKHKSMGENNLHQKISVVGNIKNSDIKSLKAKKSKVKSYVNPNAITNKDSDSEHESDNEIESETEQSNNQIMNLEVNNESSDEEDLKQKKKSKQEESANPINKEEELKRTIFVGNVPFDPKCKKEIKKIFNKYGVIDTVRIRTVPVKDGKSTPKLAVIRNELHPERSTVNVYVKFRDVSSAQEALVENNTVMNGCHLRVTKSDSTGEDHDPRCSIFVGNLPFALEDEALRQKFENCGEIESVRIIRDKKTNAGKGFGYVNFKSKDGVELALAMSEEDLTVKNRIIRVKRCTHLTPKHKNNNQQKHIYKYQGGFNRNQPENKFPNRNFNQRQSSQDGAYRRIGMKRKYQENNDAAPPNKMQKIKQVTQPQKDKKTRKEFVGITAEKKKKRKFNKDQKKKKQLGEILTK